MKRILAFLAPCLLFAKCHSDLVLPTVATKNNPPNDVQKVCDFSSVRLETGARLIPVGTLSQARGGMAVATAGTKILFAGGWLWPAKGSVASSSIVPYVDIYDTATQTWSTTNLDTLRTNIAAVAAGNKVFFAGGSRFNDSPEEQLFATVDIYDVLTNSWTVASLSEPRAYIGAAAVGNRVLFAGGKKDIYSNPSNRVDIYDLSSNTWSTATLSEGRSYIAAVTVDNKAYFAGGYTEDRYYTNSSRTIDIYNDRTNSWSAHHLLEPKGMCSGITAGNNIYWAGGLMGIEKATCSVEIMNTSTQVSQVDYLSRPTSWVTVHGENVVVKDNKILYFRYADTDDVSRFDIYDIATGGWSIGVLPKSIRGASVIAVNNTVYIAGGLINGILSRQVWRLEF